MAKDEIPQLPRRDIQVGYKAYVSHWQVLMDRMIEVESNGGKIGVEMTAEDLMKQAIRYFQWCDTHPIVKSELILAGKEAGSVYGKSICRPYSIAGLCIHCGITKEYLYDVSNSTEKNDFYFVVTNILEVITTQNIELAMIGVFNPIVVAKIQQLDQTTKTPKGSGAINITVDAAPPLLENENDINVTEKEKYDSQKLEK